MRLERLDVRVKIAGFTIILVALFMIANPAANLVLLAVLLLALALAGTPLGGLWTALQPLLLVMALIVVVTMFTPSPFTTGGDTRVLFSVWGLDATWAGLLLGLNLVARLVLMVVASYAFTVSTSIDDLLVVLARVHAPVWLSILVTTALAFIPTMVARKDQIVEAQRARGARVKNSGPIGQLVAFVPIMVPLITNSILLADNLAVAMTSRGYGAHPTMTMMRDLRFRPSDLVVLAVLAAALAAICWLRYGLGYGVV